MGNNNTTAGSNASGSNASGSNAELSFDDITKNLSAFNVNTVENSFLPNGTMMIVSPDVMKQLRSQFLDVEFQAFELPKEFDKVKFSAFDRFGTYSPSYSPMLSRPPKKPQAKSWKDGLPALREMWRKERSQYRNPVDEYLASRDREHWKESDASLSKIPIARLRYD